MATTPAPLVWDFYRAVDDADNLGGVIHYYDEMAQSIYLSSGIKTDATVIPEGHWETSGYIKGIQVTQDSKMSLLRFDHPSNGILYGVAVDNNKLTFLRYIYAMDISQITDSWSWLSQTDNAIAQFDSAIQNIDPDIFGSDSSLFQPGARVRVHILMGDSTPYPIGTVWLDESGYGQLESTVKVSGRNTIGYYLKDQTFDDTTVFEGTVSEVLEAILYHAGLTNYKVQPMDETNKFEFKPSDTLLSGIETILDFYTTIENKMEIVELTDGTICIGYDYWISTYLPRNYYSFDEGREVFKRNITRAADGSYSRIRVTGKDSDGNELQAVTVEVENFKYWSLGRHRTKHLTAPDGLTQEGLQAWAEGQASILQYIGVAEDFVGPFRPQLVVGDIAEVVHGSTGTSLGIITQVKQVFDRQNGFVTEFSVDSGGVATEVATYGLNDATVRDAPVYSRSARVNGYNRKQSIVDLVKYTAEKANKVDNITADDVGAEKKGTSSDLLSKHNENIYAHPDIRALLNAKLPCPVDAVKGQYLRIKSVDENGNVTEVEAVSANASGDGGIVGDIDAATLEGRTLNEVVELASSNAKVPNVVNYAYERSNVSTTHSCSYVGTPGNMLLLAIRHMSDFTVLPSEWTLLGTLTESGDYNAGAVPYIQYVSVFHKKCTGDEVIAYECTESRSSTTCVIEFEGVSGFEILEDSVQENVSVAMQPEFTFSRKSTRLAVWFTNTIYFLANTYNWVISDDDIWAISDNHGNVAPILGVFVDNRPSPTDFTVDSGMSSEHYVSAFCIQVVPGGAISSDGGIIGDIDAATLGGKTLDEVVEMASDASTLEVTEHDNDSSAHSDIRETVAKKLPSPTTATAGQYLRVKSVDADGNVTAVEATSVDISDGEIDAATLGGKTLEEVIELASNSNSDADTLGGKTLNEVIEMASDASTLEGKTVDEIVAMSSDASTLEGKTLNEIVEMTANASTDASTLEGKTVDEIVAMSSDASTLEGKTLSQIEEFARGLIIDHNMDASSHLFIREQMIPMPETAKSGQYLRIADVDSNGKVVATEAADSPSVTATAVVENGVLIVVTDPPSSTATAVVENGVLIVK